MPPVTRTLAILAAARWSGAIPSMSKKSSFCRSPDHSGQERCSSSRTSLSLMSASSRREGCFLHFLSLPGRSCFSPSHWNQRGGPSDTA